MPVTESERKLTVKYWEKTLREIIKEAAYLGTEDEVDSLAEQVLVNIHPDDFDWYFQPTYDSFGVGLSKTINNEHWARDAIADALSHLVHLIAGKELYIRTMLLCFTVGSKKAKEDRSCIDEAVEEYLEKYPNMEVRWEISINKSLEDNARVLIVLNYDLK
jgi:hypothetical protein